MAFKINTLSPVERAVLARTPVIPPPNGTVSNFVNPENRDGLQLSLTSLLVGLALLFYFNRVYVKVCLMRRVGWDDATLLVAVLTSITFYIASSWAVVKGHMARHVWDINRLQFISPDILVPNYITFILPPIALVFLKASFFILYLQLFGSLRWIRIYSKASLCIITIIHTALAIYAIVIASPYNSDWMLKAEKAMVPASILGLFVDLTILIIPIIAISRLEALTLKRKIGALLIFLTGGLACFCSAFSIDARYHMRTSDDKTWKEVVVNIATLCELFVGIICACAPTASYGLKHKQSIWQRMYQGTGSLRTSLRSPSLPDTSHESRDVTTRDGHASDALRSTDRKYAHYFHMGNSVCVTVENQEQHQELQKVPPAHLASTRGQGGHDNLQALHLDVEKR